MAIYNISGGGGGSGGGTPTVDTSSLVPKSIGTAAGDIIYWSAANNPVRLGKGSNGQVLTLSSGVPAWANASATGSYLPLSGGTVTGELRVVNNSSNTDDDALVYIECKTSSDWAVKINSSGYNYGLKIETTSTASAIVTDGYITGSKVFGAVWNDFAEFRNGENNPGRVMVENGDDTISISAKRLQPGAMICSDTFGFSIGETENCECPIAVAGRVLAYTMEPREEYLNHIGEAVCAGPDGTVSIMTKEEQKEYPECVVGYISAVPDYEVWGSGDVKVDGRVWIKVK